MRSREHAPPPFAGPGGGGYAPFFAPAGPGGGEYASPALTQQPVSESDNAPLPRTETSDGINAPSPLAEEPVSESGENAPLLPMEETGGENTPISTGSEGNTPLPRAEEQASSGGELSAQEETEKKNYRGFRYVTPQT